MRKDEAYIREQFGSPSQKDSAKALKSLFDTYSGQVMRYIRLYVHSREAAEELVCDVFLAIWERREMMCDVVDFKAYIFTVAKFKVCNHLRANRPDFVDLNDIPIELFASTTTTPEDDFITGELIEAANKAIEQLPSKTKIAFKLVRENGMKYREAAEHMGISVKTLETHITAAMKALSHVLCLRR